MNTELAMNAREFYHGGMEQLNGLLVGEEEAKRTLLLGAVTGGNIAFVGGTGTGKTELLDHTGNLFGLTADEQALIPTRADLKPKEITGGSVVIEENGIEKVTRIHGLLSPKTRLVTINEFNRTSPHGLNTLLETLEKHVMEVDDQKVALTGLEFAVATMNPGERSQNTFPVSLAHASRFSAGAVMGESPASNEQRRHAIFVDGFTPKEVAQVTTLDALQAMRGEALRLPVGREVGMFAVRFSGAVTDVLKSHEIHERGGRLETRMLRNARGLAALYGETNVTEEHFVEGAQAAATAVASMIVRGGIAELNQITDAIKSAA